MRRVFGAILCWLGSHEPYVHWRHNGMAWLGCERDCTWIRSVPDWTQPRQMKRSA